MALQVKGSAHMHEKKWHGDKDGDRLLAGPPKSGMMLSKGPRVPGREGFVQEE